MKKFPLFSLWILLFFIQSCSSTKKTVNENPKEIISIEAENLPQQVAYITDQNKNILIIKNISPGNFTDTLSLPEGYYKINIGKEYSDIYLQPGMDLKIYVDGNQFDETIRYEGTGADINNFLAAEMLANEKDKQKYALQNLVNLPEKDFLKTVDSLYQAKLKRLNDAFDSKNDFTGLQAKKYLVERNQMLSQYPRYKSFILKKPYQTSPGYPAPLDGLGTEDPALIKVPGYLDLVVNSLIEDADKKLLQEDFMYGMLVTAEKKFTSNPALKEKAIAKLAQEGIGYTKKLDDFYAVFDRNVKDPAVRKVITEKYNNLKKLQAGNPSPDFTAYDINGKEYHLSDFKGKNVYIDLWATWCAPCRAEIPFLEKLKKEYEGKDVVFVSIDVYDDKGKWEKMVKSGKITGIQLIIPERDSEFLKAYDVTGIPRFIFIDKEGKIIDNNASRPSNPKTKELIDKYL